MKVHRFSLYSANGTNACCRHGLPDASSCRHRTTTACSSSHTTVRISTRRSNSASGCLPADAHDAYVPPRVTTTRRSDTILASTTVEHSKPGATTSILTGWRPRTPGTAATISSTTPTDRSTSSPPVPYFVSSDARTATAYDASSRRYAVHSPSPSTTTTTTHSPPHTGDITYCPAPTTTTTWPRPVGVLTIGPEQKEFIASI